MSTVTNEGVKMSYKSVRTQVFTVTGLIVTTSTNISKPKDYIEAYTSIK